MIKDNKESITKNFHVIAGKVIRDIRTSKGMSLQDVSNKLKTPKSRQTLSRYETGQVDFSVDVFKEICYALDENPSEVFEKIKKEFDKTKIN